MAGRRATPAMQDPRDFGMAKPKKPGLQVYCMVGTWQP